jgi:hypothetical protein
VGDHGEIDAQDAAHDMVVQLEAHGLPTLCRLLDRENLLAAIRARDLGYIKGPDFEVFFRRAEAFSSPSQECVRTAARRSITKALSRWSMTMHAHTAWRACRARAVISVNGPRRGGGLAQPAACPAWPGRPG